MEGLAERYNTVTLFSFSFSQETTGLVDQCSFQEPMGTLFKGNLHIDIFHFYERVHYVEDPSESKLKQYQKKRFLSTQTMHFYGLRSVMSEQALGNITTLLGY